MPVRHPLHNLPNRFPSNRRLLPPRLAWNSPRIPVPRFPPPSPNSTPQPQPKPISSRRCPLCRPWAKCRREPRDPTYRNPPLPWPLLQPRLRPSRKPVRLRSIRIRHNRRLGTPPRLRPPRRLLPSPCRTPTNPCNWHLHNRPSPLSLHQGPMQWAQSLLRRSTRMPVRHLLCGLPNRFPSNRRLPPPRSARNSPRTPVPSLRPLLIRPRVILIRYPYHRLEADPTNPRIHRLGPPRTVCPRRAS